MSKPINENIRNVRIEDGKVSFWYELIRPDRVFKTAVSDALQKIAAETGYLILNGKP